MTGYINQCYWFEGVILLAEPLTFYTNYENSRSQFYYSERPYDYGPGFGLTIGAGLSLVVSGGLSIAMFCMMVRKFMKTAMNAEQQVKPVAINCLFVCLHNFAGISPLTSHISKVSLGLS